MTVKSYGDSDILVLIFNVGAFSDSAPVYPTGNATITWKPRSDMPCEVIGVDTIGSCTAAGTDAVVTTTVYNASIGAPNIAMFAATTAVSDAADLSASSTTPQNPSTGKQFITSADGLLVRCLVSPSTMTVDSFTVYVTLRFK